MLNLFRKRKKPSKPPAPKNPNSDYRLQKYTGLYLVDETGKSLRPESMMRFNTYYSKPWKKYVDLVTTMPFYQDLKRMSEENDAELDRTSLRIPAKEGLFRSDKDLQAVMAMKIRTSPDDPEIKPDPAVLPHVIDAMVQNDPGYFETILANDLKLHEIENAFYDRFNKQLKATIPKPEDLPEDIDYVEFYGTLFHLIDRMRYPKTQHLIFPKYRQHGYFCVCQKIQYNIPDGKAHVMNRTFRDEDIVNSLRKYTASETCPPNAKCDCCGTQSPERNVMKRPILGFGCGSFWDEQDFAEERWPFLCDECDFNYRRGLNYAENLLNDVHAAPDDIKTIIDAYLASKNPIEYTPIRHTLQDLPEDKYELYFIASPDILTQEEKSAVKEMQTEKHKALAALNARYLPKFLEFKNLRPIPTNPDKTAQETLDDYVLTHPSKILAIYEEYKAHMAMVQEYVNEFQEICAKHRKLMPSGSAYAMAFIDTHTKVMLPPMCCYIYVQERGRVARGVNAYEITYAAAMAGTIPKTQKNTDGNGDETDV